MLSVNTECFHSVSTLSQTAILSLSKEFDSGLINLILSVNFSADLKGDSSQKNEILFYFIYAKYIYVDELT